MKERKGKYTTGKLYNQRKEILITYWNRKRFLGLHSSENIPALMNYHISQSKIKCEKCTRQLWNDITKIELLK